VRRLRGLQGRPRESILADEDALDILENNLRVALEAVLNVARFVIAAENWESPSSYRETASILARHGALSPREARLLAGLTGLRNVIVHMYADVDYERLLEALDMLPIIEGLMGRLLGYLEERGWTPKRWERVGPATLSSAGS